MKKLSLLTVTLLMLSFPVHARTIYADVNGLVCDFCARALEKTLGKKEEVKDINVDLDKKVVTINFHEGQDLDDETITKLIIDAGYDVRGIRRPDETQSEPSDE